MKDFTLSLQRLAHFMIILTISFYFFIKAKYLLIPIALSFLFTFMLTPICHFHEGWSKNRFLAVILTFITVTLPLFGVIVIFSYQLVDVLSEIGSITQKLTAGINRIFNSIQDVFPIRGKDGVVWIDENLESLFDQPLGILSTGLVSSTVVIANLVIVSVYTFFMLLYRTSIKKFFLIQFDDHTRVKAQAFLTEVQSMTQQYLYGMGSVILILGTLNSIGLYLIGLNYAFFWGFLAAFLAVIPYIGTLVGGALPFLYSLAMSDDPWQPVAVLFFYIAIQTIEGNFITPKVVGSSIKINPLAAIFSLILGGVLWGIAGMIMALPLIAILKAVCRQIPVLKPVGLLLDSDLYKRSDLFEQKYNENRFRLLNLFRK